MKQPFRVKLRRWELVAGLLWMAVYLFLLGDGIALVLGAFGLPDDLLTRNKVFYITGFLVTVAVCWRFLRDSLAEAARDPRRLIRGVFVGWCVYLVFLAGAGILYDLLVPELSSPNDEAVQALAGENFAVMAVSAVLLAPLTEETLLRGVLFGSLREKSRPAAYAVTALVFAGMHVIPYLSEMDGVTALLNSVLYILPGVALCAAYELGGVIWTPILLHMIVNAAAMWAMRG